MSKGRKKFQEKVIIKKENWELLSLEIEKVLIELKSPENRLNEIKNLINTINEENSKV